MEATERRGRSRPGPGSFLGSDARRRIRDGEAGASARAAGSPGRDGQARAGLPDNDHVHDGDVGVILVAIGVFLSRPQSVSDQAASTCRMPSCISGSAHPDARGPFSSRCRDGLEMGTEDGNSVRGTW